MQCCLHHRSALSRLEQIFQSSCVFQHRCLPHRHYLVFCNCFRNLWFVVSLTFISVPLSRQLSPERLFYLNQVVSDFACASDAYSPVSGFALIVNIQSHIHLQYQRAHVTQVSAPDVSKSTGTNLVGHSFHGKIGSDGDSKVWYYPCLLHHPLNGGVCFCPLTEDAVSTYTCGQSLSITVSIYLMMKQTNKKQVAILLMTPNVFLRIFRFLQNFPLFLFR